MTDISSGTLLFILFVLIVFSALFSSSETGLMSLNRYRLKHKANEGHRGAKLTLELLSRPDRLLGVILLGNNFVNIAASAIATILALRYYGEAGLAIATGALTFVILVFAEVAPKTLAAIHPERIAYPAAYVYTVLLAIFYPIVWFVNILANGMLRLIAVDPAEARDHSLSTEELRAALNEADQQVPQTHQDMLLGILNLENITVEDIMVPRNDITGININDDINNIKQQLTQSHRTRLPVFNESIDNTIGILHLRLAIALIADDELTHESLNSLIAEPYFIPESTSLNNQLLSFQASKRRTALVVDEYGDIQGLVTLEDILEEIVGEFTTNASTSNPLIQTQADGSYLIDASLHIREINRKLNLDLPVDGPKTLNGLILEQLEIIPEAGTSLKVAGVAIEITKTTNNAVKSARIQAPELPAPIEPVDDN
ncbi:MAG: HlyC/CorC family transporter [Gammaproteobacteria bacterium]|nr:HlyC/CorC family transporter [Gammaproteobacteria bacterium]